MELSHLRAFVAASRERNVGRAAVSLSLTASPVSRTIQDLERELGIELFERRYHDLVLTPAGDELLPRAVAVLAQVGSIAERSAGPRALRIGVTPWSATRFRMRLLDAVDAVGPCSPAVSEKMSSALLHDLRHGDLDMVLIHLPVDLPGITTRAIAQYRFSVFTTTPHDVVGPAVLADFAGRTAVALPPSMQQRTSDHLQGAMRAAGIISISEIAFSDVFALESRMRRTGEIIVADSAIDTPFAGMLASTSLVAVPLKEGEVDVRLGVAWRTDDLLAGARVRLVADALHIEGDDLERI